MQPVYGAPEARATAASASGPAMAEVVFSSSVDAWETSRLLTDMLDEVCLRTGTTQ